MAKSRIVKKSVFGWAFLDPKTQKLVSVHGFPAWTSTRKRAREYCSTGHLSAPLVKGCRPVRASITITADLDSKG